MRRLLFFLSFSLLSLSALAQAGTYRDTSLDFEARTLDLIGQMTLSEKISQLCDEAEPIERLDVPRYGWWNEALHGVARNGRATVFPQSIALAATFDTTLIEQIASAIADEARAKYNVAQRMGNYGRYAGLTFWSPNINIFRDPRWGRGQETFGEDPYLASRIGIAFVRGMQGNHPRYLKTAACAKHFAVHSGPEGLRHEFDVHPSAKDLWETYLPAFKALVQEARVESVMGAYNRVYGQSASGSEFLLRDILRGQWGFKGHIVSDCGAIDDIWRHHGLAKDAAEAAAIAVKAGVDLNCGSTYHSLDEAIARGLITEADLDALLFPLFMTRMKLGMFDSVEMNPYNAIPESVVGSKANAALARKAAVESMVLVQNRGDVLPLAKDTPRMLVTGPYAADTYVLMGNYFGIADQMTTFLEGIASHVPLGTSIEFKQTIQPTAPNPEGRIGNFGRRGTEPVIVVLGRSGLMEGESGDAIASTYSGDMESIALPEHQIELLKGMAENKDRPIIAVVTTGSPVDLTKVCEYADAVIVAWYAGQEGGGALGDLLFGDAEPSGRLPVTFPSSDKNLPAFEDYTMKGRTYRYQTDDILFPFGYGLSYTSVGYSDLSVSVPSNLRRDFDKSLTAEVMVTNSGQRAARETVQFYVSAPGAGGANPISSLVAFDPVELQPGESKIVRVEIPATRLQSVDEDGKSSLLRGRYILTAASAAPGKRSAELNVASVNQTFSIK